MAFRLLAGRRHLRFPKTLVSRLDRPARSYVYLRFAPWIAPRHARLDFPGVDSSRGRTCLSCRCLLLILTYCLLPVCAGARQFAARIAEANVAGLAKPCRSRFFHRKIRRSEGLIVRRAFGAQRGTSLTAAARTPSLCSTFCPSDLPVKKSGSAPLRFGFASDERAKRDAERRARELLLAGCSSAAPARCDESLGAAILQPKM